MTETAPRACVIGHPVAHSRSPLIHNYWLREHGLRGAYERLDIAPENLLAFLDGIESRGYVGANVILPHKEAALRGLRNATDSAKAMGAVNTLWLEKGELHGDNTDVTGFLANLDEAAPGWDQDCGKALVLGAGGAARAVVHALLGRGFRHVAIANRSHDRAAALAERFGKVVSATEWNRRADALEDANLVVNATSLGMNGQPPLELELGRLPANAVVHDLVYVPLETPLLAAARARRVKAVDGLGMLLHQAAPGFARWFGVRPQVTRALRDMIAADIIKAQ